MPPQRPRAPSLPRALALALALASPLPLTPADAQELFDVEASALPAREVTQGPPYKTLPLLPQYADERARGVRYLSAAERAALRVRVCGGRLCDARGAPLNAGVSPPASPPLAPPKPAPTPAEARAAGYAIFVMDAAGELYASFEAERDRLHHSSLLAGAPVACAGELLVFDGRLLLISNQSGHYRPPPRALAQALDALRRAGADLSATRVLSLGVDL
jgi:hypothetical protein